MTAAQEPPRAPELVAPAKEPNWVGEIVHEIDKRARPFFTTAWSFLAAPTRFGRRWSDGELDAMNPLWFAASAIAVMTTVQRAVGEIAGFAHDRSLLHDAGRTVAPYAYYLEIGLAAHLALRAMGSKKRVASSIGVALYVGGTVAALAQLVVCAVIVGFALATGSAASDATPPGLDVAMVVVAFVSFGAFYTVFASAMAGVHRVGALRLFVANAFAWIASGLVCAVFPPPTLHFAIVVREAGRFIVPSLRVGFGL